MNIFLFVGLFGSIILFLLIVFGCWFYYCYWKLKRCCKWNVECFEEILVVVGFLSLKLCFKRIYKSDEDCYYGFNFEFLFYLVGYCFYGGFLMVSSVFE